MASRASNRRVYEDRESGSSAPMLIVAAVALFGLAVLLIYICVVPPTPETGMGAIRDVLVGLGGSLAIVFPLFLIWVGILCIGAARGMRVSPLRVIADALLIVCLFTAVHVFFTERIVSERMTLKSFANFVSKSYGYGMGGGAIGALLAWPLYNNLGVTGGFIATLLIAIVLLIATGRMGRFVRFVSNRAETRAERRDYPERPARRNNIERAFDIKPSQRVRPTNHRPSDPHTEETLGADDDPPRRKKTVDQPLRTARRKPAADDGFNGCPARVANQPARRKPAEAVEKDELFDSFDDFDRLEAEVAAFDAARKPEEAEKPARKSFTPDRPSILNKVIEPIIDDIPEVIPEDVPQDMQVVEADKKSNVSIDDLKIEPQAYETPDDDPPLYNYPPIDLLARGDANDDTDHSSRDMQKARLLEDTLKSYGISAKLTGIAHGPVVTRFELQPAPGVRFSRISAIEGEIAMNLAATSINLILPIPGKAAIGIEFPNDKVEMVHLRDVLESAEARKHPSRIAVGLGKDNSGRYIVADIAKMPHVLIAGQTGSGKSVCINAIITSILFRSSPEEVKLILIDPKVVELSIYNDIPHLVCPVVTDPKKAASALDWAVAEMTKRYKLFAERGVRDIKGYNKSLKAGEKLMPQMVIIIDELADLMMVSPGEVEDSICRLAQLARACGMHLVIATQRPSVNVITDIIRANIPTRIAFVVASTSESKRTIGCEGAEKLLGNGDMLFVPNGMKSMRVQGAWVSDDEIRAVVEYIKQSGEASYDPDMLEHMENAMRTDAEEEEVASEYDPRLPEAIDIVIDMGQASISMLQRRMRIGYAKAGRLMDEMAQRGIISEADGAKPRQVLITREEAQAMFEE